MGPLSGLLSSSIASLLEQLEWVRWQTEVEDIKTNCEFLRLWLREGRKVKLDENWCSETLIYNCRLQ